MPREAPCPPIRSTRPRTRRIPIGPRSHRLRRRPGRPPDGGSEAIRRAYIQREASIRSIGTLFHVCAVLFGLLTIATIVIGAVVVATADRDTLGTSLAILVAAFVFYAACTAVNYALGYGLRALKAWARWAVVALTALNVVLVVIQAVVALMVSPTMAVFTLVLGNLIPAYVLYLLLSEKAGFIFSTEYVSIIARTPHVKARTSMATWLILVMVLLMVAGFVLLGTTLQR